jgi:hypothetical protein
MVGCVSPLKRAYGRQIEDMMRAHIIHITKDDFFPAFYAVFNIAMTESNIQGGFRGAGILPFDPECVISTLDLKLRTPTPPSSRPSSAQPWVSQLKLYHSLLSLKPELRIIKIALLPQSMQLLHRAHHK